MSSSSAIDAPAADPEQKYNAKRPLLYRSLPTKGFYWRSTKGKPLIKGPWAKHVITQFYKRLPMVERYTTAVAIEEMFRVAAQGLEGEITTMAPAEFWAAVGSHVGWMTGLSGEDVHQLSIAIFAGRQRAMYLAQESDPKIAPTLLEITDLTRLVDKLTIILAIPEGEPHYPLWVKSYHYQGDEAGTAEILRHYREQGVVNSSSEDNDESEHDEDMDEDQDEDKDIVMRGLADEGMLDVEDKYTAMSMNEDANMEGNFGEENHFTMNLIMRGKQ